MTGLKPEPQFEGRVLSMAGLDPSGGAGLLADIKTISMHGCFGSGVVTAQTVQNTCGVGQIAAVDSVIFLEQLKAVLDDMGINAIKIGMLHSEENIKILSAELNRRVEKYILVVDPVIKSSSGAELLSKNGVKAMIDLIFPLTSVLTPNIPEAEILSGVEIKTQEDMLKAAKIIKESGVKNVLITGGHLEGNKVVDVLLTPNGESFFTGEKIAAPNNHGTGCALSTSLTCYLSLGFNLESAVEKARQYVLDALKNTVSVGKGNGPINLIYNIKNR